MTPQRLMQKYEDALSSHEWRNVEPLLRDDVCVTFTTGTFRGKPEVRKASEHNFATIRDEHYTISDRHWIVVGDERAVCLFRFKWRGVVDGQPSSGRGRGTSVLVNLAGEWKLVTEHLGPDPS